MRRGTDLNEPAQWLAQFLAHCDEDATHGCDPDKIAVFDLVRVCAARTQQFVLTPMPTHGLRAQHNYHCKADKWEGDDTFVDQTKADLKTSLATYALGRPAAEWEAWVDARTFWVTETKCAP